MINGAEATRLAIGTGKTTSVSCTLTVSLQLNGSPQKTTLITSVSPIRCATGGNRPLIICPANAGLLTALCPRSIPTVVAKKVTIGKEPCALDQMCAETDRGGTQWMMCVNTIHGGAQTVLTR